MNILDQEDLVKGLPDDELLRLAKMPEGPIPQYMYVSEVQRRSDMRKRFAANQPQQNMSVADQVVQEGIGSVQPTMMAEGGRTPFTAKYANGGGIGVPQMANRFRRNLRLNRFGLPEQIDPTTEAEFVDYNRGLDVGIGLPIFESYRQEDLGPVPPSMAESNRAALANLGDVILRDQTTRFDLPPDAYATGRRDTPVERGIKSLPSMAQDFVGDIGLPETDYSKFPYTRARQEGEPLLSNIVGAGSLQGLFGGSDDQLTPMGEMTFAGTSDTPRGDDTPTALTSAQILSNARENIENTRNRQNVSSAELLDQIQPNQIEKTATDFEAPTVVDDPVKRAVQTLDDIGANTDNTVVTGPTVEDAAKTDPVSIAAKQYADLLGGEKNDKMRNAMMLASLGAGIAKGDTAGGLQQAANVAASYQQKEIDRAEKGLDRAIKREDAAATQDIALQRLNQTTEYYAGKKVSDALALEQTRERIQATQRQNEQSANNNALSFLTSSLDQQLKVNVGYRTMSPEEKYSTIKSILDGQASILKEFGHGASNNLDGMVERIARQRSGLSSNPAPTGQIAARYDSATGMRQ